MLHLEKKKTRTFISKAKKSCFKTFKSLVLCAFHPNSLRKTVARKKGNEAQKLVDFH